MHFLLPVSFYTADSTKDIKRREKDTYNMYIYIYIKKNIENIEE